MYEVFAFMEIEHTAVRKQYLEELESTRFEHAGFGLGQISESRKDNLDIEFVSGGRKRS